MCPLNAVMLLLVILVLISSYRSVYEKAQMNVDTLGFLLDSSETTVGFFNLNLKVKGFYKGRKVILKYTMGSHNSNNLNPAMELASLSNPAKVFYFDYPRPTKNTQLRGNKIYYYKFDLFRGGWGNIPVYSEEEFIAILEELTQAAQILEHKTAA